jgi:ribulose-5-phosphate 4-epimerase/fuculose-1-phosphate aldolase
VIVQENQAERIADLVLASHILENEGVLDSFGHISVRSATHANRFFIPRAMPPALVQAEDLVEIDNAECTPVAEGAPRLNGERFIHSEIYKARPDVQCVIHSHSYGVIPFGIAGVPLRPVVPQAGFLPLETPVFEIREATGEVESRGMLVTTTALGAFLAKKLGDAAVILMRGHGDTVVGASVRQATVRAVYTEINARILQQALQLSARVISLDEAELRHNATENFDVGRPWDNFRRRLEKNR